MRLSSHLFLRVEPTMRPAIASAARAQGIGRCEFIRRAVNRAITGSSDRDPPPPATPAGALRASA